MYDLLYYYAERTPRLWLLLTCRSQGRKSSWPSHINHEVFNEQGHQDAALKALVLYVDAIFCTISSTALLFLAAHLASKKAPRKIRIMTVIDLSWLNKQEINLNFLIAAQNIQLNLEFHLEIMFREP